MKPYVDPVDVIARPFAAFFTELFCASARPNPDSVGTARLPAVDDVVRFDLCVECLRAHDECSCD
jgi:hypothetical protein